MQSIENLTLSETFELLDRTQTPIERTTELVRLYAGNFDISRHIDEQYGLSPDEFASVFRRAFTPFFENLPDEYFLESHMELVPLEQTGINMLMISYEIIAKEVVRYSQTDWLDTIPELSTRTYSDFFTKRRDRHNMMGEGLGSAGGFTYLLIQEKTPNQTFDTVFSAGVVLNTRDQYYLRDDNEKERMIPVELRRSKGYRAVDDLSLSDLMVICRQDHLRELTSDSIRIGMTTSPSGAGKKHLARHSYWELQPFLANMPPALAQDFAKSQTYKTSLNQGRRYKLLDSF